MEEKTVSQVVEEITGLIRHQVGSMPKGAKMQITDSMTDSRQLLSVALYDQGGYPLFAVNMDLQGVPALTVRQRLHEELHLR